MFLVLGNFLGGKICSKISWRRTFIISQALFLVSLFSATLNNTFTGFIICIYLSCLFAGVFLVCFTVGTLSLTGTGDRTTALSTGYMFFNIGYAIGVASAGTLFQTSYKWVFYFDCLANLIALLIFIVFIRPSKIAVTCTNHHKASTKFRPKNSITKLYLFMMFLVHGGLSFLLPLGLKQSSSTISPATQYGWLMAFSALVTMILSPYTLRMTKKKSVSSNLKIVSMLHIASYFFLHLSELSLLFPILSVLLWGCAGILLLTYGEITLQRSVPYHLSDAAAAAYQSLIQMGAVAGPILAGGLVGNFSFLIASATFCTLASLSAIAHLKKPENF